MEFALALLLADIIHLKNGGKIEGIARKEGDRVVIETLGGEMTVPADSVVAIDTEHVALIERYYEKAKAIEKSAQPVEFLELAVWARENKAMRFVKPNLERAIDLAKKLSEAKAIQAIAETARDRGFAAEMRPLWQRVLILEPENETARRELGFRRHDKQWLTEDEYQSAIGNVKFEGKWMSVSERDLILKERSLRLDQRAKELDERAAKVASSEAAAKDLLAKAEATLKEAQQNLRDLEDRERKLREREEELAQYKHCRYCRVYYRVSHVCEGAWFYCKSCCGYFQTGHSCKK